MVATYQKAYYIRLDSSVLVGNKGSIYVSYGKVGHRGMTCEDYWKMKKTEIEPILEEIEYIDEVGKLKITKGWIDASRPDYKYKIKTPPILKNEVGCTLNGAKLRRYVLGKPTDAIEKAVENHKEVERQYTMPGPGLVETPPIEIMVEDKCELCRRWISTIRAKAQEFEYKQLPEKRVHPTLDDIASEIHAFFVGLNR